MTYSIMAETQRQGLSEERALSSLIGSDDAPGLLQLAVIEAPGTVENVAGGKSVAAAGADSGDQRPARGNMLASPEIGRAGQADEAACRVNEFLDKQPHGRRCLELLTAVRLSAPGAVTMSVSK